MIKIAYLKKRLSKKFPAILLLCIVAFTAGCMAPKLAPILDKEKVRVIQNVAYYEGKDADPVRHLLDIYLPTTGKNWPTVLILHGGAWIVNDKSVIGNLGYAFANAGVAAVCANYRLFPSARHPSQIQDLVHGLSWTKKHLKEYGADTDDFFLLGYSAGATITTLAALDPKYLRSAGLRPEMFRGVITISGVYDVKEIPWPLRHVFTDDPRVWKDASPINHVHKGAPPFLILYAEKDIKLTPAKSIQTQSRLFYKALKSAGEDAFIHRIPGCNHDQIVEQAGRDADSKTFHYLMEFINANRL